MNSKYSAAQVITFTILLFFTTHANSQTARFNWSVNDRYKDSWNAWSENSYTYKSSYVHPEGFILKANASSSSGGGEKIERYIWRLKGITQPSFVASKTSLVPQVVFSKSNNGAALNEGQYTLSLKLVTSTGKLSESIQTIEIKDWLIVSIGDSFSSGEGNPDVDGIYKLLINGPDNINPALDAVNSLKTCKGELGRKIKMEDWECRRCHRSKWSAPALTAKRIEETDRHSSVTFLSFACSGARTEHLIDTKYRGIEFTMTTTPDDEPPLPEHLQPKGVVPSQLESVKEAVGNRVIDVLFISIGINDLKFSEVITDCGTPTAKDVIHELSKKFFLDDIVDFTVDKFETVGNGILTAASFGKLSLDLGSLSCVSRKLTSRLIELYDSYDRLAKTIKETLKVKEVYFIEYPTNVFQKTNGSPSVCECLDIIRGITGEEANWLGAIGTGLNAVIAAACLRNGWNNVFGVFERFQGKGYCQSSNTRYFRRIPESLSIQGNINGAIHPNRTGHEIVRDLLDRAVELKYKQRPAKRVTVTFKRARTAISTDIHDFTIRTKLDLMIRLKPPEPFRRFSSKKWPLLARSVMDISRFPNRQWFSLNKDSCTFSFDIYESPQPIRIPTEFDIVALVAGVQVKEENIVSKIPLAGILAAPQSKTFSLKGNNPFTGLECTVKIQRISNLPTNDPVIAN